MLQTLTIRNIVLIESLTLEFAPGLVVLSGETGSGKSILLDALGLALGARAEQRLVRQGSEQASVAASFDITDNPACQKLLQELDLPTESPLMIRRSLGLDGKGKVLVQDTPISVAALRQIGDSLLEIHGQHEQRGLLEPRTHRVILDAFGGLAPQAEKVRDTAKAVRHAEELLANTRAALLQAEKEEEYLRHVTDELAKLNPHPDEEDELAEERRIMMQGERLASVWQDALKDLSEPRDVSTQIRNVERSLLKSAGEIGTSVIELLSQAADQIDQANEALESLLKQSAFDPKRLEEAEERLFALRAAARKHQCSVGELSTKREAFIAQLKALERGQSETKALEEALANAQTHYRQEAEKLSKARTKAASALEKAIMAELPPLKLGAAQFTVQLLPVSADATPESGLETIEFHVATNPGSKPGALAKVASGGELSRLMLACKVVLAATGAPTMIFDEVDTGIGGATASAVGKRLSMLAQGKQVLVVTHQPQVAAFANQHWQVAKAVENGTTRTSVTLLNADEQREELARMLAGAEVTQDARSAAGRLLEQAQA
jgi:DNA repair protein RecN (Recombination protein N)